MKSAIVAIIAVGMIVGGFFVVRIIRSQTAAPLPASDANYRLVVLSDAVSLQHATETKPQSVQGIVAVNEGDTIITSADGRARLVWPNETVTTIEEDSQVVIKKLSNGGAQSRIELVVGDIWSKITRILGSGEYYEVETQDTVAAVRGTVFRTTYRSKNARVQAIEHTVRVFARTTDGAIDEASHIDVAENNEVALAHTAIVRKFTQKQITAEERRERIFERIQRERVRDIRQLIEIPKPSAILSPLLSPTPTTTPTKTLTPTTTPTPTIKPTLSASPTISERAPTPTPTPTLIPTPTPTPTPMVKLESVFPRTVSVGATFSLEGANFIAGRYEPRVTRVLVGGVSAEFHIITGGTSIFVTAPQLNSGVYDVSAETTDGDTVSLPRVLTIQ